MIILYASSEPTSADRCLWLLEELELPYERRNLDLARKDQEKPEYLSLNPNGKVPTLRDDDFLLWESFAINTYLSEKHRPELHGFTLAERAYVHQWTHWVGQHIKPRFSALFHDVSSGDRREAIQKVTAEVTPFLRVLENALEEKLYLVGNRFTLADINVGAVIHDGLSSGIDVDPYPNIETWMRRLTNRPAFKRVYDRAPAVSA